MFRFVYRERVHLERGDSAMVRQIVESQMDTLAGNAFEEICRAWVWQWTAEGRLPFRPQRVGMWWIVIERIMNEVLDREEFGAHLEAATRQAGFPVERREGLFLYLRVNDMTQRLKLEKAYEAYTDAPQYLEDIVQAHLSTLKKLPPITIPTADKEAANALLPILQQTGWLREKNENNMTMVYRPFVAGLIITYIFDFPQYRAYLNNEMAGKIMQDGGYTLDDLHERALQNLRLHLEKQKIMVNGWHTKILINCETHEGYASSTILLPDIMAQWAKKVPGRMVIGIPNRDFIIAFSHRHPAGVSAIARQVRKDAAQRQYPLLPRLLVWEEGVVKEFEKLH